MPFKVADCQTIQKTFERAAAHAVTEESVFAMMTPILSTMRAQAAAVSNQIATGDALSTPESAEDKMNQSVNTTAFAIGAEDVGPNFRNLDKSEEGDEGFFTRLKGNWAPGGDAVGGLFDSKCIPCGFRLDTMGQMVAQHFEDFGSDILEHWKQWLMAFLRQIQALSGLFSNTDQYIDICALIKFFLDFMCVPDLQRMLSALMALMSRVSFDFGGIMDLILGFIAPLVQPFLSGLVDILSKYIMMVIKPIECIIDSIQDMIRKLDYNVMFQNIDSLDKHIGFGGKTGPRQPDPRGDIKLQVWGSELISVPRATVPKGDEDRFSAEFNMAGPIGREIQKENARRQAAVETAHAELIALQNSSADGTSAEDTERYRQQIAASKKKYNDSVQQRDLSALGRINDKIETTVTSLKSSLFSLIGMLREAAQAVEGFFHNLFDELKKIMGEFIGGSGSFAELLIQKMAIVQMISLISSIIAFLARGADCDSADEDAVRIERFIDTHQGMKIWTDDQGNVHIEEDSTEIENAINKAVSALGVTPSGNDPERAHVIDRGIPDDPGQRLQSLIEFTGDPVLDAEIARTTEALTTPVNVTFKCPFQTSVAQAEQVNKWIEELNSE